LKNPEAESLKYQVLIYTSAIASGVSIEHDLFDFVAGLGEKFGRLLMAAPHQQDHKTHRLMQH